MQPDTKELETRRLLAQAVAIQRKALAARARETENPVLWMEAVWLLRGDATKPFSLDGFGFLEEILMCKAPYAAIMAGSGVGKTEAFFGYGLAMADFGKRVIYCLETATKTRHLVQERVNPNFRRNPYLVERNRGDADNVELKKLGSGYNYYLGLGSDSVTRTYHGDVLILDESDAMDATHKADMKKRLSSAENPIIREMGNPTTPGYGIHKAYEEGDQRKCYVKCPHCGSDKPLHFSTHVDKATLEIRCPDCGKKGIDRFKGHWVITNPNGKHPSWHIHRLMAAVCNLKEMADNEASEDRRTRSAFVRMDLGEPFAESEGGLSQMDVLNADGGPEWGQVAPGGFLLCDPGGNYDVQLFKAPGRGKPYQCIWVGTVKDFDELAALASKAQVAGGLVDWGPEQKGAEKFCKTQYGLGRLFKRVAYRLPDSAGTPDWMMDNADPFLILANRTGALDKMVEMFRGRRMLYPSRVVKDPDSRFSKHMKAPRRVVEPDTHGIPKARWVHEETNRDDQFHCAVYASIYIQTLETSSGDNAGVGQAGD